VKEKANTNADDDEDDEDEMDSEDVLKANLIHPGLLAIDLEADLIPCWRAKSNNGCGPAA